MSAAVQPRELWEATTHVLEVAHDPDLVMRRGLEGLCRLLGADRADGGRADRGMATYRPSWWVGLTAAATSSFELPLDDALLRRVLATPGTFVVGDVREEIAGTPTGDLMASVDTRGLVVRRLDRGADGGGVVCVDWVGREPDVAAEALALADEFITRVLSPLLHLAETSRRPPRDPLAGLTAAERDVCRLAAAGATYRDIAAARRTSISTVGHQLSAARRKLGAPNTAALCRLVAASPPQQA